MTAVEKPSLRLEQEPGRGKGRDVITGGCAGIGDESRPLSQPNLETQAGVLGCVFFKVFVSLTPRHGLPGSRCIASKAPTH